MAKPKTCIAGCLGIPLILFGSCAAKMSYDAWRYELPGEILTSKTEPTKSLRTPYEVASALDQYVQPRFAILRDKNFGILRIIYRKHAGVAQLKVDSSAEHEIIANVNATKRKYAIGILHCAIKPTSDLNLTSPRLALFYLNRQKLVTDMDHTWYGATENIAKENGIDIEAVREDTIEVLPELVKGHEQRITSYKNWEFLLRPVLATQKECLSCHTKAKQNSLLGVMLYAVQKDPLLPAPTSKKRPQNPSSR